MYFETIADMKAQLLPIPTNIEFTVGGYFKPGDGGGGTFIWNTSTPFLPPDFGIIFQADNNQLGGRFQRIFSGPVNVRWFGAIKGGYDPDPPTVGGYTYPNNIFDVTPYVHRARACKAFSNNGTIYFPKGQYPGAFDFSYTPAMDEINIVGDGRETVLMSNLEVDTSVPPYTKGFPILTLGYKTTPRWAKVTNLTLDGSRVEDGKPMPFSDGVMYSNSAPYENRKYEAGRWKLDQVYFLRCRRGVFKPYGNIANHYIDCTWSFNNYGVYAVGALGHMHNGCDRYTGGELHGNLTAAVYYSDPQPGGGQIIFDGTIIERNPGWGIYMTNSGGAKFLQCALSLRNIYFEWNGDQYTNGNGDIYLAGVRSVRIDDCSIWYMALYESSVNLYNCAHVGGGEGLHMDQHSSLVAYEHRYVMSPSEKLFVNSISYDASPELGDGQGGPAPWQNSSVWGPLRVVKATKLGIIISTHFDGSPVAWEDYDDPSISYGNSFLANMAVLGNGSNWLSMPVDKYYMATNVIGYIPKNKYYVWSIHVYTEDFVHDDDFYGEIIAFGRMVQLGRIYFKQNQWACSYGMKYVEYDSDIRLTFKTKDHPMSFYMTDFQIVQFDDLASANAFVNSREFAIHRERQEE